MMMKTCEHHLSVYEYGVSRATCGSYQEELPSNIRKGRRCRLQIHEIGEGDSGNSERDALGAEVVGKDLAVEDHAGDVDAAAVEEEEDVAIVPVRFCAHGLGKGAYYKAATPIRRPATLGIGGIGLANDAITAASMIRQAQQPTTPVIIRGLRPVRSIIHA
jgi:hypothetical protein